jgi:hypothetical protein
MLTDFRAGSGSGAQTQDVEVIAAQESLVVGGASAQQMTMA